MSLNLCHEAYTVAEVAAVGVARVDIVAKEAHAERIVAEVGSRRPIVAVVADIADIGTIAVARSGKEDEVALREVNLLICADAEYAGKSTLEEVHEEVFGFRKYSEFDSFRYAVKVKKRSPRG